MRETVKPRPAPEAPEPEAPKEKKGYPLAATIIVSLLLVLALFGGRDNDAGVSSGAESIGFILGWAFAGVFLWGIAWAITIRHASRGWKWSSFATVVALGLLTGLARLA